MRHPVKNKYPRRPDLVYQSEAISRFINTVMWDGKKDTATKLVYDALDLIKAQEMDPLETQKSPNRPHVQNH